MRVAGEHEVDERGAGVFDDDVGVVGLVRHEDDWRAGLGWDGEIEVGVAGAGVVDAGEPEAVAVALDGNVLVDQDGCAMAGERPDDQRRAEVDVVVAEDGVAQRRGERGEDFSAAVGGVSGEYEGKSAVGDEISGEQDEVGVEGVGVADDALEEVGLGELVEVDVAELSDAVAVEGAGQIGDGDCPLDDVDFVAAYLAGVESKACSGGTCADEKAATA